MRIIICTGIYRYLKLWNDKNNYIIGNNIIIKNIICLCLKREM